MKELSRADLTARLARAEAALREIVAISESTESNSVETGYEAADRAYGMAAIARAVLAELAEPDGP